MPTILIEIEDERCDGCGLCVGACPESMFAVSEGKALVKGDPARCSGCPNCADACAPDAIIIFKLGNAAAG